MDINNDELLIKAHRLSEIVQKSSKTGVDSLTHEEKLEADEICNYIESYKSTSVYGTSMDETCGQGKECGKIGLSCRNNACPYI